MPDYDTAQVGQIKDRKMDRPRVNWGIIGPGAIAQEFLRGADGSRSGFVSAVGSRNPSRAGLAERFAGLKVHGSYEALLADREIEAVYIATPHTFHAEWAIKAANAGKHVLCEKPMGMDTGEVEAMFAAARENGTFLAEAYMYRLLPLTDFVLGLLRQGKIGEVRMIKSSFGFAVPGFFPDHRLFNPELGGGAILDLGGYPLSMARLIAGAATGEVLEPSDITAFSRLGPTGVDEISSALLSFPNGIIAELSCSIALWQDDVLHIQGTQGRLEIDSFWFGCGKYGGVSSIRFTPVSGKTEIIALEDQTNIYSFQFEAANAAICAGRQCLSYPAMSEADSIGNARISERWLREARGVSPALAAPADR